VEDDAFRTSVTTDSVLDAIARKILREPERRTKQYR
jgi:hypothetical protein